MMLEVKSVDLHYGAAQALRNVSLHAEVGEVTCVLGRNGVGKTSLLDALAGQLRAELDLREPYSDPGVEVFGLRNAVFALGDTFLEVVSPIRPDASAARLLERRGGDAGYMLMFQVEDLDAARRRAHEAQVREVLAISLDDIAEVHLHPADMRGAIVSLSRPLG